MLKISLTLLSVAAAAVGLRPEPAAAFGPGAVIVTLRNASTALDDGNLEALAACFDVGRTPHVWVEDSDGKGHMASGRDSYALAAVGVDGKPFAAASIAAFTEAAVQKIGAVEGRAVKTTLVSVRADCASAECSYGVADLDRIYEAEGKSITVRVRVTALMRYDNDAHGFRVFHWHESVRG